MALTDSLNFYAFASLIDGGKQKASVGSLQSPHSSAGGANYTTKEVTVAAGATVTVWDIADYDSSFVPVMFWMESTLDVWGEWVIDVAASGMETRNSFQIAAHMPRIESSTKALTQADESAHAGDTFSDGEEGRAESLRVKNPSSTTAATVTLHILY